MVSKKPPPTQPRTLLWSGEVTRLLLAFGLLALLARRVEPHVLGTYLSLTTLVLLAPRLLDAGLPHALGYFLRTEPRRLRSCTRLLARHVLLAAPLAALIGYALRFVPFANASANRLAEEHWLRLALFVLSELSIALGLSSFLPTGRFRAYLATTLIPPLLFIGWVTMWPHGELSAGQLLDVLLATSIAGALTMTVLLSRAAGQSGDTEWAVREAYAYGMRSYGSAIAKIAGQRFDRLYLITVLGAAGYAQYSLAVSIRDMATFPANLYAMTLRNRQIDLIAREGKVKAARRLLLQVSAAWLLLGFAAAAVLYPLWPVLVTWGFGAPFAETADFLKIIAFSGGPIAMMGFAWNHLYAMKRPGWVTGLTWLSLLVAVPVFMLLIGSQGPRAGVALAVVIWAVFTATMSLTLALVAASADPQQSTSS